MLTPYLSVKHSALITHLKSFYLILLKNDPESYHVYCVYSTPTLSPYFTSGHIKERKATLTTAAGRGHTDKIVPKFVQ